MRSMRWMGWLLVLGMIGCADSPGDEATYRQELAVDGPWEPPAELLAQAASYDVTFVTAGPWVGTSGCSRTFTEGAAQLKGWLEAYWPQVDGIGGYSCRPINGDSSNMSVHATGRAIDIHIPLDGGQADNDLGDPVANWLLEHAEEIGIQTIIWDRWLWRPNRDPRDRYYAGAHPHHDHLHVELTPAGARMETPWFQGEMGPPELSGCDEPLPAEGGVVDDSNSCFQAFGPAQFWRRVDGMGVEGGLRWTNAFESDDPSNWARWRINLAEAGTYKVEYHSVPEYAVFGSTQYTVKFGDKTEDVVVDQAAGGDGWVLLGEYDFVAGPGQWVAVYDNFNGPVAEDQHVIADAIRLSKPGMEPVDVDIKEPTIPVNDDVIDDGHEEGEHEHDHEEMEPEEELRMTVDGRGGCSTTSTSGGLGWLILFALLAGRLRR